MRPLPSAVPLLTVLAACAPHPPEAEEAATHALSDSAFAALQDRGHTTMGVDQYTSTHRFDDLPDGGRIELQHDGADPDAIDQIRQHLQHIAVAFKAGDFRDPAFVHDREMPGTGVMAQKRGAITYTYAPLPRGGEVRIRTSDPDALDAIHHFMAAQRGEHRASGHTHH